MELKKSKQNIQKFMFDWLTTFKKVPTRKIVNCLWDAIYSRPVYDGDDGKRMWNSIIDDDDSAEPVIGSIEYNETSTRHKHSTSHLDIS